MRTETPSSSCSLTPGIDIEADDVGQGAEIPPPHLQCAPPLATPISMNVSERPLPRREVALIGRESSAPTCG